MSSSPDRATPFHLTAHGGLWLALAAGLALKASILLTRTITFDADEAILGIMARHILGGERPVFFYGQSYMGALDAYLTVPFFIVFGQTVTAMRLLQVALYAGVLISTYTLALRLNAGRFAAFAAAGLVAAPPVLFSLYTSSTLGDYVEVLLLNNLILLIGLDIFAARRSGTGRWLALGMFVGLGWWSMAPVVVAALPVAVIGLVRLWKSMPWIKVATAAGGFVLGALPWFYSTLVHGLGATVSDLSGSWFSGPSALGDRLLALMLFNLPALFGLRPPWSVDWIALPIGLALVVVYGVALWRSGKAGFAALKTGDQPQTLAALITLGWGVLLILFLVTPFGGDPTGRYLLPLWPGLAILTGGWLAEVRRNETLPGGHGAWIGPLILAAMIGYNLWGNVGAMQRNPPGLTKQFDPISQIPEDHDAELIRFLDSIGADRGYSNYWITFRFAFLTDDRILFSPRLPYKADLSYTYGDDRYPPYSRAVDSAQNVVYVTSNHPALDQQIGERLAKLKVTYDQKQIGSYTVFYNLSRRVTPDELGPFGKVTGRAIHSSD